MGEARADGGLGAVRWFLDAVARKAASRRRWRSGWPEVVAVERFVVHGDVTLPAGSRVRVERA